MCDAKECRENIWRYKYVRYIYVITEQVNLILDDKLCLQYKLFYYSVGS